jgi:hypothetical protein
MVWRLGSHDQQFEFHHTLVLYAKYFYTGNWDSDLHLLYCNQRSSLHTLELVF